MAARFPGDSIRVQASLSHSRVFMQRLSLQSPAEPCMESGVSITVITMQPESIGYEDTLELEILISKMKNAGMTVRTTKDEGEHFAVIDRRLVWHGGMNLLGKADAWDNLMRLESTQAAVELMELAEKVL